MIKWLRRNVGTVVAFLSFCLLCVVTFGNLGEIVTEAYWRNVRNNLTSIGLLSVSLTMIQVFIKQGLAEQALQRGLNTELTQSKYNEHRDIIKHNTERMIYLPYFLQSYNKMHTDLRRNEFLVNNNLSSERALRESGRKSLIKRYEAIKVNVIPSRIKWATNDVVYNKYGQIITLQEYRTRRLIFSTIGALGFMVAAVFLTKGLFFTESGEPLWQKFVKLGTYIVSITISSVFAVIKEYEKGAFGVANELDEINQIWHEFEAWQVPESVINELKEMEVLGNGKEADKDTDGRRDLPAEQEESKGILDIGPGGVVSVSCIDTALLLSGSKKLGG